MVDSLIGRLGPVNDPSGQPFPQSTNQPFDRSAATLPNLYVTFIPPLAKVVMLFSTLKGPVQTGSGEQKRR
jgi:hypothetical protein